jgi:hypothetical protein
VRPLGQQGDELGVQVMTLLAHHLAQLGGHREAAGGRERLGDLRHRVLLAGPRVHPFRAGPQGEDEHHVAQVHRLPPRAGPQLTEGGVDQVQAAVADHQVGRLDVPMGQAGLPEPADDPQPLVDQVVVDLDLADLVRRRGTR